MSDLKKEKAKQRYWRRCSDRTRRHGNWRQIYVNAFGMCQGEDEEGDPCVNTEDLEFHETFGEEKGDANRMQIRILFCLQCHQYEHGGEFSGFDQAYARPNGNLLQHDIAFEIERDGGRENWMKRYELEEAEPRKV